MHIRPAPIVDSYSSDDAVYRIHLWTAQPPGWAPQLEAWEIYDATDVREVLDWIETNRGDRASEIFVDTVIPDGDGWGVHRIRLLGVNPNEGPDEPSLPNLSFEPEPDK